MGVFTYTKTKYNNTGNETLQNNLNEINKKYSNRITNMIHKKTVMTHRVLTNLKTQPKKKKVILALSKWHS